MTIPPDEHGDLLRRVMRAEADSVVPSPDGLEIIRHRIENRGLRGLLWWRIGASVAAAALVAGIVVVSIPEIRENVGITEVKNGTEQTPAGELPSSDSTFQPPPTQSEPGGIQITTQDPTKPQDTPAPAGSVAPSQPAAVPSAEPSSNPCVTNEPTPDPGDAAAKCPTQETNPTAGTGPKPKPSVTKTPAKPSPTPTADAPSPAPTGCGDTCETPTAAPTPAETPSTTVDVSSPAS